jgi:hypothetical protein
MYRAHYTLFEIPWIHLLLKKKYSEKIDGDNASKIEYSYIPRNIDVFLKSQKGHQRYVCNIE